MSITAATVITTELPGTSLKNFSRKKARKSATFSIGSSTGLTPEYGSSQASTLPLKRTPSFDNNVNSLCGRFPSVHQGIITSLLETAANDYYKASSLIQQVSESGVNNNNNSNHSGGSSSAPWRSKRTRDWSGADVSMEEDVGGRSSDEDLERRSSNEGGARSSGKSCLTTIGPPQNDSARCNVKLETCRIEVQKTAAFDPFRHVQSSQPISVTTSPVVERAGNDPAPSPHPVSQNSTVSPVQSVSLVGSQPHCSNSSQSFQGLKQTIQVLSRVVLKQSDKISSLQTEQHRLGEENRQLKSSLLTANEEVRQYREANQILQFYLSSHCASSDFLGSNNNGNGPGGHGSSFDFFNSSNRMPDVF